MNISYLQVVAGRLSPQHRDAAGPGLEEAAAGSPQEFNISLRDAWGNACGWGDPAVQVQAFWLPSGGWPSAAAAAAGGMVDVIIDQTSSSIVTVSYLTPQVGPSPLLDMVGVPVVLQGWQTPAVFAA